MIVCSTDYTSKKNKITTIALLQIIFSIKAINRIKHKHYRESFSALGYKKAILLMTLLILYSSPTNTANLYYCRVFINTFKINNNKKLFCMSRTIYNPILILNPVQIVLKCPANCASCRTSGGTAGSTDRTD